jgi:hypothetical protein
LTCEICGQPIEADDRISSTRRGGRRWYSHVRCKEKLLYRGSKQAFLKKRHFVFLGIAILIVAALLYVASNIPPAPARHVEAQAVSPSYNETLDELTIHAFLVPSDDYLCLSKVEFPSVGYSTTVNQPLYKNGTALKLVCSDWSKFAGTPYSGASVSMLLHFADVNTGQEVQTGNVTVTYP